MFHCDCCGLCCKSISNSPIYQHLDRGDGICKYFDDSTSLCSIYENRPVECNVDAMYELFFKSNMTKEEYYKLNYMACEKLKSENKQEGFYVSTVVKGK